MITIPSVGSARTVWFPRLLMLLLALVVKETNARLSQEELLQRVASLVPNMEASDCVYVDAYKTEDDESDADWFDVMKDLEATEISPWQHLCSACIPKQNLQRLAQHEAIQGFIVAPPPMEASSSSYHPYPAQSGSVGKEAAQATMADIARKRFNVDGSGVKVCIFSNSFDCREGDDSYEADIASGDLPPGIEIFFEGNCTVLEAGNSETVDEGRAMAQIIHDVAPGAQLAFFATGSTLVSYTNRAALVPEKGCDVVVDDVVAFTELYFQRDVLSQEIRRVVTHEEIPWISAAGNLHGQWYETKFHPIRTDEGQICHNFAVDPDKDMPQLTQNFTIFLRRWQIFLQWDQPSIYASAHVPPPLDIVASVTFEGSTRRGRPLRLSTANFTSLGDDMAGFPGLVLTYPATSLFLFSRPFEIQMQLKVCVNSGKWPKNFKWFFQALFNDTTTSNIPFASAVPNATSGETFGHVNLDESVIVGAVNVEETPVFSGELPQIRNFSSSGGSQRTLADNGRRLKEPEIPLNPNVCGPDNIPTTFFGRVDNRFTGTSAAAPVLAGIAALMLQANPSLKPDQLLEILQDTAIDMDDPTTTITTSYQDYHKRRTSIAPYHSFEEDWVDPSFDVGFDFKTGFGFVDANKAVEAAVTGKKGGKGGKKSPRSDGGGRGKKKKRRKRRGPMHYRPRRQMKSKWS